MSKTTNKDKLKKGLKSSRKSLKNGINEFKVFITKGNVLDLAVGVIIGGAFGKIVSSLVNDILMPLVGILLGGLDFSSLSIKIENANILYGSFIQQIIDFLIIALCIFVIVKLVSKLSIKKEEQKPVEKPKIPEDILLLTEIRDLLKKQK